MDIHASTLKFLLELKNNNNREWFHLNKNRYTDAQENFKFFVEALIAELARFDPQINKDIKASKCLFRIYRDVRFSKDKKPYKHWLAAGISLDGRKLDGPEYYIHLEPDNTFIAVGYWQPKKEHLDAIRQEIDYNFDTFNLGLKNAGLDIVDLSQDDKLQRPPAGYTHDNPAIDVLKLKSFIIMKYLSDDEVLKPFSLAHIVEFFQKTLAFKNFIHEAIQV